MKPSYCVRVLKVYCKGCELCVNTCPRRILVLSSKVNRNGFHYPEQSGGACAGCGQCAIICPEAAIEIIGKSP